MLPVLLLVVSKSLQRVEGRVHRTQRADGKDQKVLTAQNYLKVDKSVVQFVRRKSQ